MAKTVVLLTSGNHYKLDDIPIKTVVDTIEQAKQYDSKRAYFSFKNEISGTEEEIYIYADHVEAVHTEE